MSTETTTESNELPELTDDLAKIVESGITDVYSDKDPEPEDFTDTSEDAIDYVDDEDDEDVVNESDDDIGDDVDEPEDEDDDDPVVKALAPRGVTKEHIERAREIGLSDSEIREAGSVKSLRIIEKALSRNILETGKRSQEAAQKAAEQKPAEQTETEKVEDRLSDDEPSPKKTGKGDLERFDLENMKQDDYEPESWKAFQMHNRMIDEIESLRSEVSELRKSPAPAPEQQVDPQAHIDMFDRMADRVMPEVFGQRFNGEKDTPLSSEFAKRRATLHENFYQLADGYRLIGQTPPSDEKLMNQAAMLAFGDEMGKVTQEKAKAERGERIKKQAARRRSAGSSAGSSRQISHEPGSAEALLNDPDIRRAFEQASE